MAFHSKIMSKIGVLKIISYRRLLDTIVQDKIFFIESFKDTVGETRRMTLTPDEVLMMEIEDPTFNDIPLDLALTSPNHARKKPRWQ